MTTYEAKLDSSTQKVIVNSPRANGLTRPGSRRPALSSRIWRGCGARSGTPVPFGTDGGAVRGDKIVMRGGPAAGRGDSGGAMTSAGQEAAPGQPGRPAADAGHGAPASGHPGPDVLSAQPAKSAPGQSAPAKSAPAQSAPAQSALAKSAPGRSAPGRSAPGQSAPGRSAPEGPAVARPAVPGPPRPEQSREDTDIAWGEYPNRDDEDRLRRDRPPHWADY